MKINEIINKILETKKNSIYFVGCGASKADLYPAYYFMKLNSKLKSAHFTANEFNYDTPKDLGENSIVITASLGGTTPETVSATRLARQKGADVISLTNVENSPIMNEANYTIVHRFKESYSAKIEKMTFSLKLAVEIVKQIEGLKNYDKFIESFEKLPKFTEDLSDKVRKNAKEFAVKFKDASPIYVTGSGPTFEVAYATSLCLLLEMQWIPSASINSGEFFHGALEITDKDVPFLVFMNEGKTRFLDERLLEFLLRFNANVTVIDGKDFGMSNLFDSSVVDYFNPMVLTVVMRVYAEELSYIRGHALTKRRYMWKLKY